MGIQVKGTAFSQLEIEWYQKLKESGFEDIENHLSPDRPLKRWDSFKFVSVTFNERKIVRTQYQIKIDTFANDPSFPEVIQVMVKHWNNRFDTLGLEKIFELHRLGHSERDIASQMNCSKSCIHYMLKRIEEWMKLIA